MKRKITSIIIATLLFAATSSAQEVLLGQYHFNDATTYSEVGVDDAIVLNPTEVISTTGQWVVTINDAGNGVYKAYNTATRNLNQFPLGVSLTPKTGFIIKINKVEVYHKTSATTTAATQKFSYYVGTASTVASSTDLTTETNLPTSANFTLFSHTFSTPVEVSGSNKFWIYHRTKNTTFPPTVTTEVDYIKFYGTYLDPNAPVINAALGTHNIKAAKVGGSISKVIDITHSNLTQGISTSSSNSTFTAAFDDGGESGTYNLLRVTYTPTTEGYETATITLTSGSATKDIPVKAWGLPENAIAAWNFDEQTITPDYHAYVTAPSIEMLGGSVGSFNLQDTYMYEINNLYTVVEEVEVPEIAGMKFKDLGYNGRVNVRFDINARNASPNTLKLGSEYWKNPRTSVGTEANVNIEVSVSDGELSLVSAFDQEVEPKIFKSISGTAFNNSNGWRFDNIIIMSLMGTSMQEKAINNMRIYTHNNNLYIGNNTQEGKLDIISMNGIVVKSCKISGNQSIQTDLKGIYLVRIALEKEIIMQKVVF
ncbi:MAG: T9SS type A sorting domain-containing protein [Paludibacter sp.]|nr:T9SS type A sorting domain-containing protein [Paludibacter sp.]